MAVSDRYRDLYKNQYVGGIAQAWRDAGASGKAANIVRVWEEAGLPSNPMVVEIGCGDGAIANALTRCKFFERYAGFDISESGVQAAVSRDVPNATFALTQGDRIPIASDSADLVVLSHVVEHLENPRIMLYEARRIAPYVLVEVPLELHVRTPCDYVFDDLGHINKYTSTLIRHLIQTCGMDVKVQITTNPGRAVALFHGATLKRRLAWHAKEACLSVSPRLARLGFTYHETILAQRAE
jgi:hypothetical protein